MLRLKPRSERLPNPAGGEPLEMFPDQMQLHWKEEGDEKWTRIAWVYKPQQRVSFIRFFQPNQQQEIVDWVRQKMEWDEAKSNSVPDPATIPAHERDHDLVDDGDD